jgi:methionyl-tRNA formyltransferase
VGGSGTNMKIVFFGTPEYVVPILKKLNKYFSDPKGAGGVVAVVTQKPKPTGRKKILSYTAVDNWAHRRKVPVFYDLTKFMNENVDADIGILSSFGKIIPRNVIDYFPLGILNVHPSLLPQFRGASPVQAAIASGLTKTGVTIIKLDEKLDHGPIIGRFEEDIGTDDTTETLRNRLFELASDFLFNLLEPYRKRKIALKDQDHSKVSFTKELSKEDGFIPPKFIANTLMGKTSQKRWHINFIENFSVKPNAQSIDKFVKAMHPWPLAWTFVNTDKAGQSKRLKILSTRFENQVSGEKARSAGKLIIEAVQLEGKNRVSWEQFTQGYPNFNFNVKNLRHKKSEKEDEESLL